MQTPLTQKTRRSSLSSGLVVLVLVLAAFGFGCQDTENVSPEDEAAIEQLLTEYLPKMASAYATGELEVLRGLAAEKEMATLYKRINDLMNNEGRVVVPTLDSFEIEQITIWNYANAFVTTLEVWNLEVQAAGSEQVLSSVEGQRNRVTYQLKRREDRWQVLYRAIQTTFE